ncbi:respiratory burst oxidase [Marchantia polymorpha subsp. ruderalis]|uniref:NAD(P)H oxidase (H(2)O(2)-forming) n=2 Tax=Marchantia polymorpha TaxID=3197 RepID=A0A176WII2_MARPO|nr:hypothetical protein AXG93_4085s1150 [Marchantia polymorpha subsp. ruderalis]PTQ39284.1 hypothetical protein MARPO_0046s0097 [Marchantia polymorpha]BBN15723.1 hypothetical protein Mp_7g00270 [Marchantia polymorpha subsp. ruderalis]|eukprot:PTQ39284.1 hypothetical protein MARPO_0046s0097 [Marchantia polymorpha]
MGMAMDPLGQQQLSSRAGGGANAGSFGGASSSSSSYGPGQPSPRGGNSGGQQQHHHLTTISPPRRQLKDLLRESMDKDAAERNEDGRNGDAGLVIERDDRDDHVVVEVMVEHGSGTVQLKSITQPGGGGSAADRSFIVDSLERRNSMNSREAADAKRVSRNGSSGARVTPLAFSPERTDGDLPPRSSSRTSQTSRRGGIPISGPISGPLSGPISGQIDRTASGAKNALEGLRNIHRATGDSDQEVLWLAVDERFKQLTAKTENLLLRKDFAECIGMKGSEEFAEELLNALTRRKGVQHQVEVISRSELQEYWRRITNKTFDARMELFFDLCDKDLDGRIFPNEVMEMILLSAAANKLSILTEQAEEYAALIMEELDRHHNGYIELSELEKLMRAPTVHKYGGTFEGHSQQLSPPRRRSRWQHYSRKYKLYLHDYWVRIWLFLIWAGACLGLFCWKFHQYRHREAFEVMGYCVCVAKGAAETLKLNMALILLPVCRNTITYLRSTCMGAVIPFDDNIKFHKLVAAGIAGGVIVHATTHLACDFPKMVSNSDNPYMVYISREHFNGKVPTYGDIVATPTVITGIIMVVIMCFAFFLASYWCRMSILKLPGPFRRFTGFNAFWYSHHLFVVVYVLVIVHGYYLFLTSKWSQKTTWMYIMVPLTLYCGERTLRTFRATTYKVNTVEANIYPGNVLAIHMSKPAGFKYQSGMYIFLQCPSISGFEWHPFSITSAPGDEYISVHMRKLGDWTTAMHNLFKDAIAANQNEDFSINSKYPRLCIDGPYGAPAQDFRKYDVLLLVGMGIGATPFISILKNMLNDIKSADAVNSPDNNPGGLHHDLYRVTDNSNGGRWWETQSPKKPSDSPARQKKRKIRVTTNAYFYWVTREQGSFEWFKGVMNEVAAIDQKAVIEMHNYLTSVYEEGDARSALITMVQALHHAKSGVDILSGTRARTHFARPNWSAVFQRLARTHEKARIGVFYCGAPGLAKELDELSRTWSQQTTARFEFHKENF